MSIFEELSQKALLDPYFHELFQIAEKATAADFFGVEKYPLSEKQLIDLLRFSDILSRSTDHDAQNKSYKIISLLIDDYKNDSTFRSFADSVLTKLGNFPALKYLRKYSQDSDCQSMELSLERFMKEEHQRIPDSDLIFTDAQYQIFERITNSNHFSFSGPTSLGKSFILNAFIRHLIFTESSNENIIILVPTRALINQTLLQLKEEFSELKSHKVISHPTVPEIFKREFDSFIFIFTPERLISYLSDYKNPKIGYLFIDEAQKIISEKDSRSPLYYHAILQAERKSIKLYFSSPNIPNPDIFLRLFEKSTDEVLNIACSPVSQNRYFMDFIDHKCLLFSDFNDEFQISADIKENSFYSWLKNLGSKHESIIYCNTKSDTIHHALEFSKTLKDKDDERIDEVIDTIKEHLHERYYLIDCLRKGVAFHFGNLPQRIRTKVELLFVDKAIDYVFCTSTLLEGVNLPAKNIFILSNAVGLTKFSDIDFWNLAGRAGRLTKELSGNIICTRIEVKRNRWENPKKDLTVVKNKEIKPVKPLIIGGQKNFFKNMEASLGDTSFTNKNASANEVNIWNHYANIALIHELRSDDSVLRSNFLDKSDNGKKLLQQYEKQISVPEKILAKYSSIKAKYQDQIFTLDRSEIIFFSNDISYESVLANLEFLCDLYSWEIEESSGKDPMLKSRATLKYYAVLMANWMSSTPLNRMIISSIEHYAKKREIWDTDKSIPFIKNDKYCINLVINELISDIDNILRFKLKNYFGNYYDLLVEMVGKDNAGINWADYLEYGTDNYRVIELQNIGIPRHLASHLLNLYPLAFSFEEMQLISVDRNYLLSKIDKQSAEYKELLEVL